MSKSPLYTCTGDRGTTSLVDGTRVPKCCERLEAYGTIDELNSFIGAILVASPRLDDEDCELILAIQSSLFDIGAYLATDSSVNPQLASSLLPANLPERVTLLERAIDRLHEAVPVMKSFILPGGAPAACAAHIARSVARRVERRVLALPDADGVVIAYINRLSDYLFILARRANAIAGIPDTPWQK